MSKSYPKKNVFLFSIFILSIFIIPNTIKAAVLLPGNINTCGEIAVAGEYTLTGDIDSATSTCLTISSDNVIINGDGHSITGTSTTAIDGRVRTGGVNGTLTDGADAYTNLVINDLTIASTFIVGVNLGGNNSTGDYGGDGGDVDIYYSYIGSILTQGGNSAVYPSGGLGGNIMFTNTDLDIASSTISALGGSGLSGRNTDGGLDLNYTGILNRNNIILSSLAYFNDKTTQYGSYIGGTWPIAPGDISTCGTLYGPGVFTLTGNITSTSTCFAIATNNVYIVGANFSLISSTSTNSNYAINASNFSSTTIDNLTFTNFPNIITSSSSVIIKGNNLNLSTKKINSPNIIIDAGTLNLATTTFITDLLDINYSTSVTGTSTATSTALSNLKVNNLDYGPRVAGLIFNPAWITRMADSTRSWKSIASSVDGKRLVAAVNGGYIYISTDSGVTWATSTSSGSRAWNSVTSSADGMKIVAVPTGGQIYVSNDGGNTWTARDSSRSWNSVASSMDGNKLIATVSTGFIYISSDGGTTWLSRLSDSSRTWNSVTSSVDGKYLVAGSNSYIYTSQDYGNTWATSTGSISLGAKNWYSVSSSAGGNKLVAAVSGGHIYTSQDYGNTWATSTGSISLGVKNWYFVNMSLDGSKFIAGIDSGSLYSSSNDGLTLNNVMTGTFSWRGATLSTDGNKMTVIANGAYMYTNTTFQPTLSVSILSPKINDNFSIWKPIIYWSVSKNCYYSYDNFVSTSTANCALGGVDIIPPSVTGNVTLYLKGISNIGDIVNKSISFNNSSNADIVIDLPIINHTYEATSWFPHIDYSVSNTNLVICQYSYNNFASTTDVDCSLNGTDILPPPEGENTLYVKTIDSNNNINISNITFSYISHLTQLSSSGSRYWSSIASSYDGTKLVAVVGGPSGTNYDGQIYTSTNTGLTWTARESVRSWRSVASSADGTKLVAVVPNRNIYTSTSSGVTWVAQPGSNLNNWFWVTSSANGAKLAAVANGGYIHTSTDSGITWATSTLSLGTKSWRSITSSANGNKLAAAVYGGYIYTSIDSGSTWSTSTSSGIRDWYSIASSEDGVNLIASVYGGYIYTSNDGGNSWTAKMSDSARYWQSVASSADGTKLVGLINGGLIYISKDSGNNWASRGSSSAWSHVTFDHSGSKMFVVDGANPAGYIYIIDFGFDSYINTYVNIISPIVDSFLSSQSWFPNILWGFNKITCQYSYNNFASTTNADCSRNGSDILPPQSNGSNTLYVRSLDLNNSTSSASTVFNYISNGWIDSNSNQGYWYYLASNISGQKILATASQGGQASDYLYRSIDFGLTWTRLLSIGSKYWQAVASDASGDKLFASVYNGPLYTSIDGGANWVQRGPYSLKYWSAIASSADGSKLFAAYNDGYVYMSNDGGATWATSTGSLSMGIKNWNSISVSADGNKIAATTGGSSINGYIYTSTDGGVTWATSTNAGQHYWQAISSSADGKKLVAVVGSGSGAMYYGYIYTSTDSGVTWIQRSTDGATTHDWQSVSSSADGTKISATMSSGQIYTSIDGGTTWTQGTFKPSEGWGGITSSSDGNKFFAGGNYGYIKTMTLNPQTITVDILLPQPANIVSAWNPIVSWSTAASCYYSYDNWNSTSTANCALNGADLNSPINSGVSTLRIIAIDAQGNTDTASSTFTYAPYFWCGTVDSNWTTVGNWYSDNTCTTSMGSIPGRTNGAILLGSVSPIVSSTTTLPLLINSTGLTGGAGTVGIIFESGSYNTARIIGNATFNNLGYNTGNITGNATFNTATNGTLTLINTMKWGGTISGTIKGSDGQDITHLIFNNSSSNETTIGNTISTVFNNSGSNNGTINGNATFNNNQLFSMGTVNGTATLNGLSQTLNGINNVINFFKQSISRDTLFFTSGSTLNISGLATILGYDANNLLTVRSTEPNTYANLNLNGTNNLDYLRIKDISNSGSNLDLSLKTVFDDGHNLGFTFKQNSTPQARGGSTGNYAIPSVPVSHGGTLPPVTPPSIPDPKVENTNTNKGRNITYSGTVDLRIINPNLRPIDFDSLPPVRFFKRDRPPLLGLTQLPDIFNELKIPEVLSFSSTPAKFLTNVFKFIGGLSQGSTKARNITYDFYMKELGIDINNEQSLARLHANPIKVATEIINNNSIFYIVKSGKNTLATYLTYDSKSRSLAQLVKVIPGQDLIIISNYKDNKTLNYKAPDKAGRYTLNPKEGSISLIIEVLETRKIDVKKMGFWEWLRGLFK